MTVYNFEVKDWHCYFVGEAGVLVHNSNLEVCEDAVQAVGNASGNGSETRSEKIRTGPKPKGTGSHNLKIEETASHVKDGKIIAGGGRGYPPEAKIQTIAGKKSHRRPDILVQRADGSRYGINVGKTTAAGAPIKREVEALYDLEDAGIPMWFISYDK